MTFITLIPHAELQGGAAYAVFDGHTSNDDTPYVYKTTDFGQTCLIKNLC